MSRAERLAARAARRNRRRTLITILAVAFAVMLSLAMRGLQLGTYELNIKNAISLFSGYLQVQKTGYQENPSLQKSFRADPQLTDLLDSIPEITGYAPRITATGLVSFGDNTKGAAIIAISPDQERRVSKILERVNTGAAFASDSSDQILMGHKLLKNLRAQIGDRVVILAQGYDGSLGNRFFTVGGTLKTGSADLDGTVVLMGRQTADDLLSTYGRINMLALSLRDYRETGAVQKKLSTALSGSPLSVLNWEEMMPALKQAIALDDVGGQLFLMILVTVVSFGIMNTVLMSITERFKEFGVSLAVGMPYRKLVTQVILETIFITAIGLALGNLLGAGINYYFTTHPILLGGEYADLFAEFGFLPQQQSTMRPDIFLNITLMMLGISLLAAVYPIVKVYRLEPLKGIRYT